MPIDPGPRTSEAAALLKQVVAESGDSHLLSTGDLAPIISAVAQDLEDAADKSARDEARLDRVERLTRAVAEAVLAITDRADLLALAAAVRAVRDEL